MKLTSSAVATVLGLNGHHKSRTLPSRIKGAPLRTEGYAVRKDGDDVRVTWRPRMGCTSDHPDVQRMLAQIASEIIDDHRLNVTVETVRDYLIVREAPAQDDSVDAAREVHSHEFLTSSEFQAAWDDLREQTGRARLTGVTLERRVARGEWGTRRQGSKADLQQVVRDLDGTAIPARFRLTTTA